MMDQMARRLYNGNPATRGTQHGRPPTPPDRRTHRAFADAPKRLDRALRGRVRPGDLAIHPARNRHEEKEFREYFDTGLASGGALTIRERDSGKVIGASRYYGCDPALGEVEIGWTFLATACWGGRYNREVKRLMLGHAFVFADTVVFWVGEANLRSRRAMEKIGGVLRPGTIDRSYNGQTSPHVIYEIANRPGWDAPLRSHRVIGHPRSSISDDE
jgi:RimJ/RimL family protein N-acetyltransferase